VDEKIQAQISVVEGINQRLIGFDLKAIMESKRNSYFRNDEGGRESGAN
jgi:hypothetical protein